MATIASRKSEERMWSTTGDEHEQAMMEMEMDEMFDLDLALVPPLQLTVEDDEISTSTSSINGTTERFQLLSNMPTVVVSSASTDVCSICMEELLTHHRQPPPLATEEEEEEAKHMPCGHVFHSSCISAWVSLRRSCPLCRYLLLS
ncbi:E3 ubiquitin-protein ligase RNF181-like [Telopea speciosissima]|uniref:E3 ubiquitin-protein ligase RNF181-like n=1 Tax=Telopea speciosissima TaxID=54955 RepID=UPI001CC640C7|nr:E3 ubiquitin-protein ligase RNF181-like [Telopea speciosissima]